MKETGVVTEIRGKTSVVSVDKKDECSRCGLCLFKEGTNKTEFFVKSEDGVNVGDTVEIERSESGKFTGVILAFFVPLLFFLRGLGAGQKDRRVYRYTVGNGRFQQRMDQFLYLITGAGEIRNTVHLHGAVH